MLSDPIAFRYLEGDPSTTVLERRRELRGFECYIIEQWTTSRTHPTFVMTTFTGDEAHTIWVDVLSVPTDEDSWSPRLRVYFKALNQYHARRRDTPLGILMVTNLSGFPSSLTVIPVPHGDLRKHRIDFFVNENLKRLGCSGRVGLTLAAPLAATAAKFHQLYRTSDKNDINRAVIELVKICQSALMLFAKLEIDFADGLLCDVTERAINDWWIEMGSAHYNIEPHDGILGPTTVAGLLGLLMGARSRLHSIGAPVAKDAFDVEAMKRGISSFQKTQRMNRTRRLDRRTLDRLHKTTQKSADHEGWTMPRAVKSTVAELSGKGGEMIERRRDRGGIAEIETCDIERFAQLVYGDKCKWLWLGKSTKKMTKPSMAIRTDSEEKAATGKGLVFRPDEHGGFTWTARKSTVDGMPNAPYTYEDAGATTPDAVDEETADETDAGQSKAKSNMILRTATGLKSQANSGLGKFKGAVGLKTHHGQQKQGSYDESPTTPLDPNAPKPSRRPNFLRTQTTSPVSSPTSPRSQNYDNQLDAAIASQHKRNATDPEHARQPFDSSAPFTGAKRAASEEIPGASAENGIDYGKSADLADPVDDEEHDKASGNNTATPSIAGTLYNDLDDVLSPAPETEHDVSLLLRRTLSTSRFVELTLEQRSDDAYPRHLSFSLAEDTVLTFESLAPSEGGEGHRYKDLAAQLTAEQLKAGYSTTLRLALSHLSTSTGPWTQSQMHTLTGLLEQADSDQAALEDLHAPYMENVHTLQAHAESVLRQEREGLEEGGKEIETLAAKLEYEIAGLKGKLEDVEVGVLDFRKGVGRVEERVRELERDEGKAAGWWGCSVM